MGEGRRNQHAVVLQHPLDLSKGFLRLRHDMQGVGHDHYIKGLVRIGQAEHILHGKVQLRRTFRLGAEYDKEALQDRLLENQRDIRVTRRYFEFMRPYTREYARKNPPTEEYYWQRDFYLHLPRVTGYLSFFRCVAIVLGVAPLYEKEYRQPLSAECREACCKLDRFTAEITLVCREHLDTPEDVQRFLARMDREMDAISAARSKIRNKQRGCADPAERGELKKSCAACTAELSRLRKQKQTAYNMIEDNPKLKALLACELDAWVENDPYLSPREKQTLRNQRPPQEEKAIER